MADIDIVTNETFDDLAARWTDEGGTPFELTDARMQIRWRTGDAEPAVDLGVGTGLTLTGAPDHWVDVVIDVSTLATLRTFGVGVYDLVATRGLDGRTEILAAGRCRIRQGVTRG